MNHLLVIGLGLIGGSVALASRSLYTRIFGVDLDPTERQMALGLGVVDAVSDQLNECVEQADLIVLAVPVLAIEGVLRQLQPHLRPDTVMTDVGSCKQVVAEAAMRVFGCLPSRFILGHPIAGAEKSGVAAAWPHLFQGRKVILTPEIDSDPYALMKVRQLWQNCGAEVLEMDRLQHDQILARTSHLPHLLAYSLVDTLASQDERLEMFRYAAGGFRDFTRIAASDPIMWRDIFLANREATLSALDDFVVGVQRLRNAIDQADGDHLVATFTRAKAARDYFTALLNATGYQKMTDQKINFITQPPSGALQGSIRVPGDKSISHRSIMLGALAEGTTQVKGFLEGEDALATLQTFRDLGVQIEGPHHGEVTIHGVGLHGLQAPKGPLYLGNSGTSMRLLAGILAAQPFDTELTGDASLSKRPMNRVADPLRLMGAKIETQEGGRPPLKITGGQTLRGIDYTLPMASAQVKSCLLLAGLWAEGETSTTEPAPTRDHTERMLRGFGYAVEQQGATARVRSGGQLQATAIDIPADISSATFFLVAAAMTPGSDLTLEHVGINPTRDGVIHILRLMGADIEIQNPREIGGEPVADLRIRATPLKGIDIPVDLVPLAIDEFPALFIAAACAEGTTRLRGAEELRVKESDRIQVMADGLTALGIDCTVVEDGIDIQGRGDQQAVFGSARLPCYHDHRIAMSFAIAGLRSAGSIIIEDCATVNTSFPGFAELARSLGCGLEVQSA